MRAWRYHLACVLILVAQVGIWSAVHRSTPTLRRQAESEDATERIEALFLLLERGAIDPGRARGLLAGELVGSDDMLEVEFAGTTAVCKHTGPEIQYHHLKDRIDARQVDAHFWRFFVILRRKIGGAVGGSSGRLKLRELQWWFDAQAGRPLPADEVLEYISAHP